MQSSYSLSYIGYFDFHIFLPQSLIEQTFIFEMRSEIGTCHIISYAILAFVPSKKSLPCISLVYMFFNCSSFIWFGV